MHNTLDQFYSYLAETLLSFFHNPNQLQAGNRFFLYMEKESDLEMLINALIDYDRELIRDFEYRYDEHSTLFRTKQLILGDVNLIISSNVGVTEHYLTLLRNQVSNQMDKAFIGKAILILFSGKLDSLSGGTGDLTKAGMPFNYEFFSTGLRANIQGSSSLGFSEKIILEEQLLRRTKELRLENASVFDLSSIIGMVKRGSIQLEDYQLLGLFPQEELASITEAKVIKERLSQNNILFENIEFSINYGDPIIELEKKLTPAGVKLVVDRIEDGTWKLLDYAEIIKHELKKEKGTPVGYKGPDNKALPANVTVWDRSASEKEAMLRQRNIIVFNPFGLYPIPVFLVFDAFLRGELRLAKYSASNTSIEKSGRYIKMNIGAEHYNQGMLEFEYVDQPSKNRFKFKVWVINVAPPLLGQFSAGYLLSEEGALALNSEESIIFNADHSGSLEQTISKGEEICIEEERTMLLISSDEEEEEVPFVLRHKHLLLDVVIRQQITPPVVVRGWDVWQKKRIHAESYKYTYNSESGVFKLSFRNGEFSVRDEYRANLLLEVQMMDIPALAWSRAESKRLSPIDLRLSKEMVEAYDEFYSLFKKDNLLPSLAFLNAEFREAARKYIDTFLNELEVLENNRTLSEETGADLIRIGTVVDDAKARNLRLTPLHPLIVAYQLEFNEQVGDSELYEAMLKRLTPLNLLPYLKWEDPVNSGVPVLYESKENSHSPEWMYYSHDLNFKQFSGREFIRDLVNNKISEFLTNFSFLFSHDNRAPLKINVFNMGDCLQVLKGIFDHYKDQVIRRVSPLDLRPIDLYIKGSDHYVTTFEKMAHLFDKEDIEKAFDISASSKLFDFEDLLNAFRTNLRFFADGQVGTSYAHLTFYQFSNDASKASRRDSGQIPSGLSLNGLISDLPSHYHDQTYVTGFGIGYNHSGNQLNRIAYGYNSLGNVAFSKDPYKRGEVACTFIDSDIKKSLDDLYDHSHWITFVDPHFNLSFFKEEDGVIIVHYSDQYSSASGFDAITVTRKSQQYRFLLEQILKSKAVNYSPDDILKLIDLYNAINGEWLLKLISKKNPNMQKEKLSLPSAVKNFLAFYAHPEIIWVPLSLEEILRVSGGAGLTKSDGLFSTKNLGAKEEHCDDLLMVGVYELEGRIQLQFMPVEVKIGQNNSGVISKAHSQAEKTYQLLYQHLAGAENGFKREFYKSFFAKLVLMSAEKMRFYHVWEEQKWETISISFRERLMNNEFDVSDRLSQFVGHYAIVSFNEKAFSREFEVEGDGTIITLLESDGYSSLVKGVEEIKNWLFGSFHSISTEHLLHHKLQSVSDLISLKSPEKIDVIIVEEEETLIAKPVTQWPHQPSTKAAYEPDNITTGNIEIYFGDEVNDRSRVVWNPNDTSKVMHTNTGIIGTMGTGKTQFTKSLVTQLSMSGGDNVGGKKIGILIFDYKGDYVDKAFVEATGAKIYQLHNLPYNPLAIDVGENSMPLLPLHIASTLQETISNAFNLGNKQKAFLKEIIMNAYEEKGIFKGIPESWSRTAPTISDICELYLEDDKMAIDSLHAALKQLHDFEIFQPDGEKTKSLFELIDGVIVIKLSGYSADIQNLVVAITLDAFYSQMQKNGHSKIMGDFRQLTKMVLVDEADNFLSKNFASLRKILKEGREFGVGTILSTQFLNHFSTGDNEYDQYILTWIIHRVNDVKFKDIDSLFSIADREQKEQLVQIIKKLEKHHSVVNLGGSKPILIEDMSFWKLTKEGS